MFVESRIRGIAKTVSWRILATLTTMLLVYIFVRRVDVAAAVGGVEIVVKLLLYYFHERAWNGIHAGKNTVTPFVLWFTGLSGSGKSTIADAVYDYLAGRGYRVEKLDGDTVRSIFPNTGFTREARDEHIMRIGYLASMLEKNGVIVVSSFISPYRNTRDAVRGMCDNFVEVHVSTSIEECERRDIKGLYKRARSGEITMFTGIDDPYEAPLSPELSVDTEQVQVSESVKSVLSHIKKYI